MADNLESLTIAQLKERINAINAANPSLKLGVTGLKPVLIARIREHMSKSEPTVPPVSTVPMMPSMNTVNRLAPVMPKTSPLAATVPNPAVSSGTASRPPLMIPAQLQGSRAPVPVTLAGPNIPARLTLQANAPSTGQANVQTNGQTKSSTGDNYETMTMVVLKQMLKERGLKQSGNKADLIERLRNGSTEVKTAKPSQVIPGIPPIPVVPTNAVTVKQAISGPSLLTKNKPAAAGARIPPPKNGYNGMTNNDLKELLRERGLKLAGKKDELIQRLNDYDEGRIEAGRSPARNFLAAYSYREMTEEEAKQEEIENNDDEDVSDTDSTLPEDEEIIEDFNDTNRQEQQPSKEDDVNDVEEEEEEEGEEGEEEGEEETD